MPRRPNAASWSTPLAILAALALVVGLLGSYAHRAVFSATGFSDRATAALRDPDVRALLARDVTDQLVLANEADLIAARPLIESVVSGFLGSAAFTSVFRAAVYDVHRAVFSGDANTVTLTLRDVGTVAAAGLRVVDPTVAAKVAARRDVRLEASIDAFAADAARTADRVRLLSLALLGLAALLGAAALLVSRDRRRTAFQLGAAVAVGGVLVVFALVLARGIVVRTVHGTEEQAAVRGVWDAFLGDARTGAWVLAACGAVVAAAAASYLRPVELAPLARRVWSALATDPRNPRLAVLRAVALVVAGVLVLLDRSAFLDLVAAALGVALVYAGVLAILRLTYAPEVAERRAQRRVATRPRRRARRRRALVVVIAGALVALAISGFAASGGVDAPRGPITACNGHAALCDRPFDHVVLPATHNSMSAPLPGWFSSEQEAGIGTQLADGIRGLLIDTHYGDRLPDGKVRTAADTAELKRQAEKDGVSPQAIDAAVRIRDRLGFAGKGERGMYLCHSFCELGATPLPDALSAIADFMATHPDDVVLAVNQDYVTPEDFVAAVRDAGLARYAYDGPAGADWPTLREMVRSGRRLVLLAENHAGAARWYRPAYASILQETPYSFPRAAELTDAAGLPATCKANRGRPSAPLFLVNHWVTTDPVPRPSDAAKVNARGPLLARVRTCQRRRSHVANLVAVNFYREGDLFGVVDELNGVGAAVR